MASKARKAFDANCKDVDRLLTLHSTIGGTGQGRRHGLEVLNKSGVVLLTAFWEAYCEDLATEALDHLVAKATSPDDLPKQLRQQVAAELEADKNELAVWSLAEKGWRSVLKSRLASLTAERNRKLNTPKAANINELFQRAVGIKSVSSAWSWQGMSASAATKKLDRYVSLRGEVAHRGSSAKSVKKSDVVDFYEHLKKLAAKTGGRVGAAVKASTGSPLW